MDPEVFRQWDDFKQRFLKHESVPVLAPVVLILIVSGLLANYYAGEAGVMFYVVWLIFGALLWFAEYRLKSNNRVKAKLAALLPFKLPTANSNTTLVGISSAIIISAAAALVVAIWLVHNILWGMGIGLAAFLEALGPTAFGFVLEYLFYAVSGSMAVFACGGAIWIWVTAFRKSGFGHGMACVIIPGYVWFYALSHQDARELKGTAWTLWKVCFPIVFVAFWALAFKFLPAPR